MHLRSLRLLCGLPRPTMRPVLISLLLLLTACSRAASPPGSGGDTPAAAARLQVDAEQWPLNALDLAQSSIELMEQRGEIAYLTKVVINLPDVNQTTGTNVHYEFYSLPKRKRLTVSFLSTSSRMTAADRESARKAGVEKIFADAEEAIRAPQFSEDAEQRDAKYAPAPLPGSRLGLREAYAIARKEGLQRANGITLSVNDKLPEAPQVMWTFQGQHSREDSQAIHIDAITGAYIDEDRINDLSRRERAAQLAEGLAAIRAFLHPQQRGGQWSGTLTPEAAAVVQQDWVREKEHGMYFDGLHDYTVGPAADCAGRGGVDGGPASFGGNYCY